MKKVYRVSKRTIAYSVDSSFGPATHTVKSRHFVAEVYNEDEAFALIQARLENPWFDQAPDDEFEIED